jgi:hypothetical protein
MDDEIKKPFTGWLTNQEAFHWMSDKIKKPFTGWLTTQEAFH